MAKLWLLLLGEFVVVVLLATQLYGTKAWRGDAGAVAAAPDAAAPVAPATATGSPTGEGTGAPGPAAPANQRTAVAARPAADDPVGILLSGSIRSRDGGAVADASLWFSQDLGGRGADVAKDGSYAVVGLRTGEWTATVRADGFADLKTTVHVGDEAQQRHDFELTPAYALAVRIETPDGKPANPVIQERLVLFQGLHVVGSPEPVPEVLAATDYGVVFFGQANWRPSDRMQGRPAGGKDPADSTAGVLELAAPPPAWVAALLRNQVVAQQQVVPGQKEVTLVVDPAAVVALCGTAKLRLVDADTGAPLAKVRVALNTSSGGGGAQTDADGNVTLANLLPGLLQLEIWCKDHESVTTTVRIGRGEARDLGELRLGKTLKCTGRVLDADGKPAVADVQWTELKWLREQRLFVDRRSTAVDTEGRFELGQVGAGPIAIQARTRDGGVAMGVFDNPPAQPIELRLQPGTQVTVMRPEDPTKAFTLILFDGGNRPFGIWRLEPRRLRTTLRLPPGTCRYEVRDDGDRVVRSGSLVLAGQPVTVELP